jgi:hypothetical protein
VPQAETGRLAEPTSQRPGRLFRKYVLVLVTLVTGALLASSVVNVLSADSERQKALRDLQAREARTAATRIEQFLTEVEAQIVWAVQPVLAAGAPGDERRIAYLALLRLNPAITRVGYCRDEEILAVSRVAMDVVGGTGCQGASVGAGAPKASYSPVEFKDGYPFARISVPEDSAGGRTVAEMNLTFIWDVVSRATVGRDACAYVIDDRTRLIAHPDVNLVLQQPDLVSKAQVCRGVGRASGPSQVWDLHPIARLMYRNDAFRASERIDPPNWTVVIEHPVEVALMPLLGSLLGTAVLLVAGWVLSVLASRVLARRMVAPATLIIGCR